MRVCRAWSVISRRILNHEAELKIADRAVEQMSIKTPTIEQIARFLSGGNQQKIVLGNGWL